MFLAKNLKRLRIEKGLTQEELAERIKITGQAVSKWERGECYPDITLLPGLANCFEVTVDELLGMQEINDEQKLNRIYSQVHELGNQEKCERSELQLLSSEYLCLPQEGLCPTERNGIKYGELIVMLEEQLRIHPNNPGLLSSLGTILALSGDTTGRAERLCEQALNEYQSHKGYKGRASATAMLCFLYRRAGEIKKAEELARSMPHAHESREFILPNFLTKPEKDKYLRENLPGILTAICKLVDDDNQTTDEEGLRSIIFGKYNLIDPAEAMKKMIAFLK